MFAPGGLYSGLLAGNGTNPTSTSNNNTAANEQRELLYRQLVQQQYPALFAAVQAQQMATAALTAANMEQQVAATLEKKSEVNNVDPTRDLKLQQRLARNRTTARLRRERKKQEAEILTKYVAVLRKRVTELNCALDKLDVKDQTEALRVIKSFGEPPLPCQFCTLTFDKQDALDQHVRFNHTAEVKAREQFIIESRSFGLNPDGTVRLGNSSGHQNLGEEEQSFKLSRLSSEERKKRRLERNAASARLCRQRKKLYIENLKMQIPGLRHKIKALESALPKDVVKQVQELVPIPAGILDEGTDPTQFLQRTLSSQSIDSSVDKKRKRGDSESNVSEDDISLKDHRPLVKKANAALQNKFPETNIKQEPKATSTDKANTNAKETKNNNNNDDDDANTINSNNMKEKEQIVAMLSESTGADNTKSLLNGAEIPPLSGWSKTGSRNTSSSNKNNNSSMLSSKNIQPSSKTIHNSTVANHLNSKLLNSLTSNYMSSPLSTMTTFGSSGLVHPSYYSLNPFLQNLSFPPLPPPRIGLGSVDVTKRSQDPEIFSAALALANFSPK